MIFTATKSHLSSPNVFFWQASKPDSTWNSIILLFTAFSLLATSIIGQAATIRVNSVADNQNQGDGFCTLREAMFNANNDTDSTMGDCRAGTGVDKIRLLQSGPPDYVLSSGELTVTDDVSVIGNDAALSVIDANNSSRVFRILGALNVSFSKVTLQGGNSTNGGGMIVPAGAEVTINNSVLTGNNASGLGGGAILNYGGVTIKNTSIIANNTSSGAGAGIRNEGGTMYITGSDISDNHSSPAFAGGGILNFVGGHMVIKNTTINNNTSASAHGGGVENNAFLASAFPYLRIHWD